MSHTTTIKSVPIRDEKAIAAAVSFLVSNGISCSLARNEAPRAYYQNQTGLGVADLVLKLHNSRYDVGLYKQQDGTFQPRTDFWAGEVAKQIGFVPTDAEKSTMSQDELSALNIGKFTQAYAAQATYLEACAQGHNAEIIQGDNGRLLVEITTY